jgi:hypothetical protein
MPQSSGPEQTATYPSLRVEGGRLLVPIRTLDIAARLGARRVRVAGCELYSMMLESTAMSEDDQSELRDEMASVCHIRLY